jgi:hypothetical protein
MQMMRSSNINRAILSALENADPYTLPEEQLLIEINGVLRPPVGQAEFDDAMTFLNTNHFIVTVPDRLDANLVKWTITEAGKAVARQ